MKKTHLHILLFITILFFIGNVFWYYENNTLKQEIFSLKSKIQKLTPKDYLNLQKEIKDDCKTEIRQVQVDGNSMMPMIQNGSIVSVEYGYYDCNNKINRGDIVIYDSILTKKHDLL